MMEKLIPSKYQLKNKKNPGVVTSIGDKTEF